uniref:Uncharacterized protein n=1 Tax=Nomascus leucogenys TaxID=61853 RepID=A0A2I3HIS9_NOMLE
TGGIMSTHRVTFEGVGLSENESSPSGSTSQRYSGAYDALVSDEELKRRVAEELTLEQQATELERERAAANGQLTRAIPRERISSQEEGAKAMHLARQLEEKDRVLMKQVAFCKVELARLEERSSEFYKVTTEQYQKVAEEVESHLVYADLQAKILQCYYENTHQTFKCSTLASQHMHYVNHAKQSMLEKKV